MAFSNSHVSFKLKLLIHKQNIAKIIRCIDVCVCVRVFMHIHIQHIDKTNRLFYEFQGIYQQIWKKRSIHKPYFQHRK